MSLHFHLRSPHGFLSQAIGDEAMVAAMVRTLAPDHPDFYSVGCTDLMCEWEEVRAQAELDHDFALIESMSHAEATAYLERRLGRAAG